MQLCHDFERKRANATCKCKIRDQRTERQRQKVGPPISMNTESGDKLCCLFAYYGIRQYQRNAMSDN